MLIFFSQLNNEIVLKIQNTSFTKIHVKCHLQNGGDFAHVLIMLK